MKSPSLDFFEMLRVLSHHKVDYIVVGGVCGVFHGAPLTTYDLDIVRLCEPQNNLRILDALTELDGHSRLHQQIIRPNESHLAAKGHLLLATSFGPLVILATAGAGHDFADLAKGSVTGTIRDVSFLMLDLQTLIQTKEEAGRDKDKIALPILRALQEQRRKQ